MREAASKPITDARAAHWRSLAGADNTALAQELLSAIDSMAAGTFTPNQIAPFVSAFLDVFTDQRFEIPGQLAIPFLLRNRRLANLVAASGLATTDAAIQRVLTQPGNYLKLLTLYSPRNSVALDTRALFQINPPLASLWFNHVAEFYRGHLADPAVMENLDRLFHGVPEMISPVSNLQEPYFGASYLPSDAERIVKSALNRGIKSASGPFGRLAPTPRNPRKIAVAATFWQPYHSAYRILSGFIEALRPTFHLTLLQLPPEDSRNYGTDDSLFDEVRVIRSERGFPQVDTLHANDFSAVIFPEVGMSGPGVFLANLRLAPVQIALLGHSVSTFGAQIDYFISGKDVEIPENPQQHYSERLILLPGAGCIHDLPRYTPQGPPAPDGPLLIACPWHSHKCNARVLNFLACLHQTAARSIRFRLYPGRSFVTTGDGPAFRNAVARILPPNCYELCEDLAYDHYMRSLEECSFALDSFHFGGCNTVSDALFLRIPVACLEGTRWYNRIGPYMLRQVALNDLIAQTQDDYFRLATRLIHDDPWRNQLTTHLQNANLADTIYSRQHAQGFAQAITALLQRVPTT